MSQPCTPEKESTTASLFDCGVCLDTASEPVVTFCGHLFCWGCLYKWMQASESSAVQSTVASIEQALSQHWQTSHWHAAMDIRFRRLP